jgi:hypothetical protein
MSETLSGPKVRLTVVKKGEETLGLCLIGRGRAARQRRSPEGLVAHLPVGGHVRGKKQLLVRRTESGAWPAVHHITRT